MMQSEPVHIISSTKRARMQNPNLSQKDHNPILHTNGYHNSSSEMRPTNLDYG